MNLRVYVGYALVEGLAFRDRDPFDSHQSQRRGEVFLLSFMLR